MTWTRHPGNKENGGKACLFRLLGTMLYGRQKLQWCCQDIIVMQAQLACQRKTLHGRLRRSPA